MNTQLIPLSQILKDDTYQLRDSSKGKNVAELCRLLNDGFELDPITVMSTDKGYLIIDGFQRVEAVGLTKGKNAMILAKVRNVDHKTAITMAAAANQKHGQQLEKADKRKIAITMLTTFPQKSNVQIARMAFLSEGTIRKYRKEMPGAQSETRIGTDGREISLPKKKEVEERPIDQPESPSNSRDVSSIEDAILPSSCVDSPTEFESARVRGSATADKPKEKSPAASTGANPASPSPRKPFGETDELLSQFNDLMDYMDGVQSFLAMIAEKGQTTPEEGKQLEAIRNLVTKLDSRFEAVR